MVVGGQGRQGHARNEDRGQNHKSWSSHDGISSHAFLSTVGRGGALRFWRAAFHPLQEKRELKGLVPVVGPELMACAAARNNLCTEDRGPIQRSPDGLRRCEGM